MINTFFAISAIAFWLPNFFTIDLSQWFPLTTPVTIITPTPTPFVFPQTPQTSPQPTTTLPPSNTPKPSPTPTQTPKPTIQPTPTPTPKSYPSPTPKPLASSTPKPVSSTSITTQNVLTALNNWRAKNGVKPLALDQKLQDYAQTRANYLKSIGKMDDHAGFNDFIQNKNGFAELGFNSVAENQSWNYQGTADGLISQFYASSPDHNQNQLNPTYTHVGIGIAGVFTDIVFGGNKR